MDLVLCGCWRRRRSGRNGEGRGSSGGDEQQPSSSSSWNLFIDLETLKVATDNFSESNLLGQGGFGPVYKGVMQNGQEIAVKKLSLDSRQGVREFTNEVKLLLKVQHRNLVSLLGCCIASEQKMLVYPYIPNRSLDRFLFDKNMAASLDWSKRIGIIVGVAKGLLYLHEESPVKIIHRDIKASNILLDDQLNPKIADFGMARLFQGDDTHINTFKISGTYGYMAPEYALNGYLSAKTDVFSFGVLMLEIVYGRKNLEKGLDEEKTDLLSYAWKLFEEGNSFELMDPTLSSWNSDEAALCIQIALLCCQAVVSDRPDMYTVHLMLSTDSFSLPKPGRPGTRGRVGRWTSAPSSTLTNTNTTSTKASTTYSTIAEDYSRNSISVSFTSEGR
ncbi:receptor-like protein kinase [Canna indica]|uniref:Receptor-like protein kinase n=1 Tax=Canna indica TaxID=4628 RepID=A0AAQ3QCV6_9LILI|nr:receptor-like protein kinase [Canna indica]